ncbi:hypothetical protein JB92DRAFT_2729315 [Gautieria morchelliformis]|nr:hypothetical protein JB92DRAFT_2729315 [Gautieria morchelliformis]
MIDTIIKVIPLYLAPVLALTSTLLTLFAYLAPAGMLHTQVALMIISPGRSVPLPGDTQDNVDGPTIRMGTVGSCAQSNNSASVHCTTPSTTPIYDFSVLPSNTPMFLQSPTATTPAWIAAALVFWTLFLVIFSLSTIRERLGGKLNEILGKPAVARAAAWVGVLGYMIGLIAFLVNRMWFGNAVNNFNIQIAQMGQGGPQIQANLSNGFTMLWVAYAFGAVPLMCVLMKLHHASMPATEKSVA